MVCVFQGTRLLNLQIKSCSQYSPYYPLNIYRICNEITFLIPDIGICVFFLFLNHAVRCLSIGLMILKESAFSFTGFLSFLFSTSFISSLMLLTAFLLTMSLTCSSCSISRWKQIIHFRPSLFSNVGISYYKFLPNYCFHNSPDLPKYSVFIFIAFKIRCNSSSPMVYLEIRC